MADKFDYLGILQPEEEKSLGNVLDELIDFKKIFAKKKFVGILLEGFDGKLFTAAISNLDDKLADKMPADYKPLARELLLATIAKDWDKVVEVAPSLLNKPIDIPGLDEDTELAILAGLVQAVYMAVFAYANSKLKK